MRFPYQYRIGDYIRELHGITRRASTSRNLGNSSITKGEGYIGLRNSDAGADHTLIGDLPDGGFGIGITTGAGVVNIIDHITNEVSAGTAGLNSRLTTVEGQQASHASRLSAVEGQQASHASRLSAVESTNATQNSRLSSIETEIGTARGGFPNLGSRLDSHASRLGAAENDITDLEYDFTNVSVQYSILRSQMDQVRKWFQEQKPPGWPPLPD